MHETHGNTFGGSAVRAVSLVVVLWVALAGCGADTAESKRDGGAPAPGPGLGAGTGGSGGAPGSPGNPSGAGGSAGQSPPGSFGNVGVSGGQDFGAFRRALDEGKIPGRASIEATGFFAEHFTSLPPPGCGRTFCLHGMLSVSPDLARGGPAQTLLQLGMNSPIDPATVKKPPLNLAVVLDHSGSMAAAGKMEFAKEGVKLLIDGLGPEDTFTLIVFDDQVETVFGPARVTDKAMLKGLVGEIQPDGATNIYDGLEAGYRAALRTEGDHEQRRVIFLTDGLPTAGITDPARIRAMSVQYNARYAGLTTIGLGADVNLTLLRGLAESGGGNFYYVEKPAAVREVFLEELAFFVAPIAFDVELSFTEMPGYSVKTVHGTALWQAVPGGGSVKVPSVFLVSRTSTAPGPNGGRRGGGSAIIAELAPTLTVAPARPHPVGKLTLRYRLPGQREILQDEAVVTFPAADPGVPETADYYSTNAVEKNTLILNFFVAFRDATGLAETNARGALALLAAFQERIVPRLEGWKDEDLLDDLKILQRYIEVLRRATGSP